jgi:hypothetical protein
VGDEDKDEDDDDGLYLSQSHDGNGCGWMGRPGFGKGDVVGLLLDCGAGTLAVTRNGEPRGTAATGPAEEFCWAAAMLSEHNQPTLSRSDRGGRPGRVLIGPGLIQLGDVTSYCFRILIGLARPGIVALAMPPSSRLSSPIAMPIAQCQALNISIENIIR